MTEAQLIERVASETDLDHAEVEKVLEVTAESFRDALERGESVGFGTGEAHGLAAILMAAAAAEREGGLDPSAAAILRAIRNLVTHGRRPDELIEQLMPDRVELPTAAAVLQARRNAEARTAFLEEFGALRSHDVAQLAGSRAANRAALANRWRSEGRVLAVTLGDELLYPGFQFTADGRPHPTIREALATLRSDPHTTDWQAALWFATPTGWLGGRRPVDVLDDDPEAIVEAARREVADLAA
jgi:DNA-binding protein